LVGTVVAVAVRVTVGVAVAVTVAVAVRVAVTVAVAVRVAVIVIVAVGVSVAVVVGVAVGVRVAVGLDVLFELRSRVSMAKSPRDPIALVRLIWTVAIFGPVLSLTPRKIGSPLESLVSVKVPNMAPAELRAWIWAVKTDGPFA
jgi:hypothetical protein